MTNSRHLLRTRGIAAVLTLAIIAPAPLDACGPWQWCQVENAAHDAGNKIKQVATDVGNGVVKVAGGGLKILRGAGELVTGHPGEAWATVQEGGKEIINGVIQITLTGIVTTVAMADPIIGTIFFGSPSPLQGISKFIYETISRWKGKPTCNPAEQMGRLMTVPKGTLDDGARILGAVSTPAKYLSSIFDGWGAWEQTGCDAVGIGRPVREAQLSTDGLWTVDLAISDFDIQGQKAPPGRYIRLEVMPGRDAHDSLSGRTANASDIIRFSGPMMWDKDTDGDHPNGHMEVHPIAALEFSSPKPPPPPETPASPAVSAVSPPRTPPKQNSQPGEYEVIEGDNLSAIAQQVYGPQKWSVIYCANKKKIPDPDLIYPGQLLRVPITEAEIRASRCRVPIRDGMH